MRSEFKIPAGVNCKNFTNGTRKLQNLLTYFYKK